MVGIVLEVSTYLKAKRGVFCPDTVATCLRNSIKGFGKVHFNLFIDVKVAKPENPLNRKMVSIARGDMMPVLELIGIHFREIDCFYSACIVIVIGKLSNVSIDI